MPVTEQQFDAVVTRLEAIGEDVQKLTHGNGRKGLWALSDAVFGPPGCSEEGLVKRLAVIERATRESRLLQRGIAIGVGLVLIEHSFDLNLARLVAAWFGGTP